MDKTYIYKIGTFTISDSEPFGNAWKQVKDIHTASGQRIYRTVLKDGAIVRIQTYDNGVFHRL